VGPWLIQPSLNTISQNGVSKRIEPKIMEVLVCLAQHMGEVVSKEKLLQAVWPDMFVSDDVLKRSVSELRRVFGDDAHAPRFIETVSKRGYRLVVAVTLANKHVPGHLATPRAIQPELSQPRPRIRKWRIGLSALGIVVPLGALLLMFNIAGTRERGFGNGSPPIHTLAVLPLQNLSGDPSQEYFSDGMTEELITELSRIRGMKVISRTSVMRYKNSDKSLPEIARQLRADGIVEGSVLRTGTRVRITAQLIYAHTDANVWAETYDRDSRNVFAVQEAVASAIADKVKATLIPNAETKSKTPHTVNLKAHEAYLRGVHEDDVAGGLGNHEGLQAASHAHHQRAVEYYKQAVQEDPQFALAYLGSPDASIELIETGAKKALELDDDISEAHLRLGAIELVRDRNWQEAERELRRAIELNPSNAAAHHAYAYFLDAADKLEEGMKEWEQAQELDPKGDHLSAALYSRRQFDRLIELERSELASGQLNAFEAIVAHKTLMVAYARLGKHKESIEAFSQGMADYGYKALAEDLRRGYERGGYEGALREWLKGVQKEKSEFPFHFVVAYAHAELGERDAAFAWLPKMDPLWDILCGGTNHVPNLVTLRIEPMWDPLRSDPKFEDLVRRVGFPQ
jgi:TolB-like protein/DNA-binding winged helix-turn-helix (wHTH) protein